MIENRIYGPPGSGKTYKIVKEILPKCIDRYGQAGIIVISYTRTAASEIISRLGGKVQTFGSDRSGIIDGELGMDVVSGTKIKAGTLHSLCFHALNCPEIASGKSVMERFFQEYRSAKSLVLGGRLEKIAWLRNKCVSIDDIGMGGVKSLWRIWEEFKNRNELMDFTDLIDKCFDMKFAPGQPLCIICDEAQDMTPLQMRLLRQWGKGLSEIYFVGDDDQSIFSFIGADPNELIREDLVGVDIRIDVLGKSRRLCEPIHKYAKKYIEKITKRQEKDFVSNGKNGIVANIRCQMGSDKMFGIMLNEAKDKSVMVLASCDYMLNDIIDKMKKAGVPFSNRYKLDDNRWNPISVKTEDAVSRLLRTQTIGDVCIWAEYLDKKYIKKIEEVIHDIEKDIEKDKNLDMNLAKSSNKKVKKLPDIKDIEKDIFYREFLERILNKDDFDKFENIWRKNIRYDEDEDKEENKDKNNNLNEIEETKIIRAKLDWFLARVETKYLKRFEYVYKVMTGRYRNLKDITVGTIHSAKGRESQVVFICPDKSPATVQDSLFDKSDIIRLFYVAMTRASEKLYFCMPSVGKSGVKFL